MLRYSAREHHPNRIAQSLETYILPERTSGFREMGAIAHEAVQGESLDRMLAQSLRLMVCEITEKTPVVPEHGIAARRGPMRCRPAMKPLCFRTGCLLRTPI